MLSRKERSRPHHLVNASHDQSCWCMDKTSFSGVSRDLSAVRDSDFEEIFDYWGIDSGYNALKIFNFPNFRRHLEFSRKLMLIIWKTVRDKVISSPLVILTLYIMSLKNSKFPQSGCHPEYVGN